MCLCTCTGSEDVTLDSRFISSILSAYLHDRVPFRTAYLTAAIDSTVHRATATDSDIRFIDHGLLTLECIGDALTASEHITMLFGQNDIIRTYLTTRDSNCTEAVACIACIPNVIADRHWALIGE